MEDHTPKPDINKIKVPSLVIFEFRVLDSNDKHKYMAYFYVYYLYNYFQFRVSNETMDATFL